MLRTVFFLLLMTVSANAQIKTYFGYFKWDRLPDDQRMVYIAGALDSLVGFSAGDQGQRTSQHYSNCVHGAGVSAGQLSENVHAYARAHPEVQRHSMQVVLGTYLGTLCGLPPQK
jgi:hypothetical protein